MERCASCEIDGGLHIKVHPRERSLSNILSVAGRSDFLPKKCGPPFSSYVYWTRRYAVRIWQEGRVAGQFREMISWVSGAEGMYSSYSTNCISNTLYKRKVNTGKRQQYDSLVVVLWARYRQANFLNSRWYKPYPLTKPWFIVKQERQRWKGCSRVAPKSKLHAVCLLVIFFVKLRRKRVWSFNVLPSQLHKTSKESHRRLDSNLTFTNAKILATKKLFSRSHLAGKPSADILEQKQKEIPTRGIEPRPPRT